MQSGPQIRTAITPPAQSGLNRIAAAALILANLIIVAVTVKEQWGYLQVLYLFWFEAVILGAYNVLKMLLVFLLGNPFGERLGRWIGFENRIAAGFYGLIATGFFVVKFAGFAVTLGFALLILPVWLSQLETGQLTENSGQWVLMAQAFKAVAGGLPFVVVALVVSHGISFVVNFIGRREYDRTNILLLVFWPYARMALIVAVMIIAGVAAALTPVGRTTLFAVTGVSLKLLADLASHAFEHVGKPTIPPRLRA